MTIWYFYMKKISKIDLNLCPELKINGLPLENTKSEKYLGDIISHDGKNNDNLHERKNKNVWFIIRDRSVKYFLEPSFNHPPPDPSPKMTF